MRISTSDTTLSLLLRAALYPIANVRSFSHSRMFLGSATLSEGPLDVVRSIVGPPNEALQQTRSALTPNGAALAAERWCWADFSGLAP